MQEGLTDVNKTIFSFLKSENQFFPQGAKGRRK